MSPAFILFLVWLALCIVGNRLPGQRRILARLGLLAASPLLILVALATQGLFPALICLVAVPTLFPGEIAGLWRYVRELTGRDAATADPAANPAERIEPVARAHFAQGDTA